MPDIPFSTLLDRYAKEVSVAKSGARWEQIRLAAIGTMNIGKVHLPELGSTQFAAWRDERLKTVSGSTVVRECNLLSHVCNVAVNEWHWLTENPLSLVSRPKENPHRERLITQDEIDRLLAVLGYVEGNYSGALQHRVALAFLFAIETACRASEITGIRSEHISGNVCTLPATKNGTTRHVPLSPRAIEILALVKGSFDLDSRQLDSQFRAARRKAMCDDIHFHDTRHLAITQLAKKLSVLDLARMVGHADIMQLSTYYNEPAESIARRLA